MDVEKINSRLDSVDDLIKFQHELDSLRLQLKKVPDLEKLLANIFAYSVKQRVNAVYFENISLIKLKEF
jgi:DNA mismatch repair ATPase MutS